MKKTYLLAFLLVVCARYTYAQTTYNLVTLDRGVDNETNCIYITNYNSDSCYVIVQYKIGNRNTNWIDYPIEELIPPSLDPQKIGCIDSTIIGLKLVDVIVVNSSHIKKENTSTKEYQEKKSFRQKLKSLFTGQ